MGVLPAFGSSRINDYNLTIGYFDNLAIAFPLGIGLCSLSLLTILGNAMVVHAIRTERRLHTVSNMFILSLAIADLTVGLIVMPISSAYVLIGDWIFGIIVCQLWLVIDYTASTASIFNLLILSLDRYWSIRSPLKYLCKRTKKRALGMIGFVWVISSSWAIPIIGWHQWTNSGIRKHPNEVCETEFSDNVIFKLTTSAINFFIPMFLMVILYYKIFREIKRRGKINFAGSVSVSCAIHAKELSKSSWKKQKKLFDRANHLRSSCASCSSNWSHRIDNEKSSFKYLSKFSKKKKKQNPGVGIRLSPVPVDNIDGIPVDVPDINEKDLLQQQTKSLINTNSDFNKESSIERNERKRRNYIDEEACSERNHSERQSNSERQNEGQSVSEEREKLEKDKTNSQFDDVFNYGIELTGDSRANSSCVAPSNNSNNSKENQNTTDECGTDSSEHGIEQPTGNSNLPVPCSAGTTTTTTTTATTGTQQLGTQQLGTSIDNEMKSVQKHHYQQLTLMSVKPGTELATGMQGTQTKAQFALEDYHGVKVEVEYINGGSINVYEQVIKQTPGSNDSNKDNDSDINIKLNRFSDEKSDKNNTKTTDKDNKNKTKKHHHHHHHTSNKVTRTPSTSSAHSSSSLKKSSSSTLSSTNKKLKRNNVNVSNAVAVSAGNDVSTTKYIGSKESRPSIALPLNEFCSECQCTAAAAAAATYHQNALRREESSRLRQEKKAARQLGVILGAFILCWMPYIITFIVTAYCTDCVSNTVHQVAIWMGYVNSFLNPFLYALCNENFKQAFKKMLGRAQPHHPSYNFDTHGTSFRCQKNNFS